jgi:gamma-glutamylcyclotransferase (GGCT)/AIG2-like uncharacterized protein YtfP
VCESQYPIFVYGTLMTDQRAHHLLSEYIDRLQHATLPNAVLFSLGTYPMARSGAGIVRGEAVWLSSNAYAETLRRLDQYEGSQYDRQLRSVFLGDSQIETEAWVYFGLTLSHHATPIPGGDWRQWYQAADSRE